VRGERLGPDEFLRDTHGYDPPLAEIPRIQVEPLPPTLEEIFAANFPHPIARAYRRHGYTLRQIAEHLGCSYSTINGLDNRGNTTRRRFAGAGTS
jgi:hypothetical protein